MTYQNSDIKITRLAHEMHVKRIKEARETIRREAIALAETDEIIQMNIRYGRIARAITDLQWYTEKAASTERYLRRNRAFDQLEAGGLLDPEVQRPDIELDHVPF